MPNKTYSTSLKVDEETFNFLKKCCSSFHGIFNKAIDLQLQKLTHEITRDEQIIDFNSLLEKTTETNTYLKLDEGLIKKAVEASHVYFQKWWGDRQANPNSVTPSFPSYMKAKNYFRTSSILKVSKGGYVYFPKFGRVKLAESNYVPIGSYKNVTVALEGSKWYISLESLEESQEKHELSGTLEVHIDEKGNIFFEDNFYSSILESERYQEAFTKWKKLSKKLKRQIEANSSVSEKGTVVVTPSKSMKLTKKQLEGTSIRMKNLRRTYYQTIVKDILTKKPQTLVLFYAKKLKKNRTYFNSFLWDDHIFLFVKMLERGIKSLGIEIKFEKEVNLLNP